MIISQVDYFLLLALGTHKRLRPNIRRFVTIWKLLLTKFLCPRHYVEKWSDVVPRNRENNIQFRWQAHGGTVELNPNSLWLLLKNFINICQAQIRCSCVILSATFLMSHAMTVKWCENFPLSPPSPPTKQKNKNKLHCLSPWANYTDRVTAASRRSDCQLLRIKGATWSAWRIPSAVFSVF
jgi:hypothetical protein